MVLKSIKRSTKAYNCGLQNLYSEVFNAFDHAWAIVYAKRCLFNVNFYRTGGKRSIKIISSMSDTISWEWTLVYLKGLLTSTSNIRPFKKAYL